MQQVAYRLEPDARETIIPYCLERYARIAVSGGANTGKTTLCSVVTDRIVIATDDFIPVAHAMQPAAVIQACTNLDRFVVEGTLVPRALRKKLQVDVLIWLSRPVAQQTDRQRSQQKGLITVFESCRADLNIPIIVVP